MKRWLGWSFGGAGLVLVLVVVAGLFSRAPTEPPKQTAYRQVQCENALAMSRALEVELLKTVQEPGGFGFGTMVTQPALQGAPRKTAEARLSQVKLDVTYWCTP